eukprot:PhM_4_TR14114/c2_g2_i1/m.42916
MMSRKLPALLLLLIPVLLPSTAVVSATTCDFGVLETWPNKGTCHEIHHNSKKYESLISIFDAANVPDLLNSGSYNVKEFYVSVSAAMCHAFVVDVGSSGLSVATNTVSELKLSGSQSAATYQNVVRGVMLRICPEPRVYNIVWYFTQETTGLAENTNGNSEQHYYKSYGQANWIDAVAICDATTFAGLRGYLTVADDLQETNWLWNHFRENLWMGVSDDGNQGTWTVRTGPHAGELAYLNFAPGQPDNTVGSDLTQHYAINFDGRWDDHVYTANHLVVCEYGGLADTSTSSGEDHGAIRVEVATTTDTCTAATFTPSGTGTPSASVSQSLTLTATDIETTQNTLTSSGSLGSPSRTVSPSRSHVTATPSVSPSATASTSRTQTPSPTVSRSFTESQTLGYTLSTAQVTVSPSRSSGTATPSVSPSATASTTPSHTVTQSFTESQTLGYTLS